MTRTLCQVCAGADLKMLYEMRSGLALTSLGKMYPAATRVWACQACAHLQTDEMDQVDHYYAEQYNILSDSEEEDQIYEVREGRPLYRTEHQLAVLLEKVPLKSDARLLDYGCAKSSSMQALLKRRADLQVHLFDVSDAYQRFWARFLPEQRWATFEPKAEWKDSFDLVTSFFALEHIVQPLQALQRIRALVRPGGYFYCVVPNVATNIADFIVVDHVNHFTESSLACLLQRAGFEVDSIDAGVHRGAFVVLARRPLGALAEPVADTLEVARQLVSLESMAAFWQEAADKVVSYMDDLPEDARCAVYGAGFYGSFITACLGGAGRIRCFVDQNPFLQGRRLFDRPIVAPAELDEDVDTLLVGLNPAHARQIIADIPALQGRSLRQFYL
ncbi:methyltransferase domain-containing protein [Pseudomonas sp. DY-1]|uniref:class I SAM-dependent methyltransferase n=1 Tax=Pseudomonas sp. DY-1 TaxID=1755504 RepID=UPI000EA94D56|nr:class I SAM-dependent methyltransferase [Pseudomonas sp. DY-1]AYF85880.1 methyltransferase domain-containing protein [Pseudomonas sp. DY-1]